MIRPLLSVLLLATPAHALDGLQGKDIVVLGEVHDNALHHLAQADLIGKLRPKAVVFEMLTPAQAELLNGMSRSDMTEVAALLDWANSSWPDFALYQPIFEALAMRPVAGAAAARSDVRRAFDEGALVAFGEGAERFGLDRTVLEPQLETRKQMQFASHCKAMPLEMMGGMVEAQRYRDAIFAHSTLEALETYGAPVVLIAGNGHARIDWGVPAMIKDAAPEVSVFSVGFVERPSNANDPRFNHTIVTNAAQRGDPCDAFKS